MSKIWSFMILSSVIIAVLCGNVANIPDIIMTSSYDTIQNLLKLAGMMCFWSGIFNILEHTSLITKLSKGMSKFIKKLFKKEEVNDKALENISLNMTCNLIGVGNAATVYSLKAIDELNKINIQKDRANDSIITFVLINTASLQLIPTGMITLRAMYNSENPVAIVPYVWIVTICALCMGLLSSRILNKIIK